MTVAERIEEIIKNDDYGDSVKIFEITNLVRDFCETLIGKDNELKPAKQTSFTDKDWAQNNLRAEQRKILESEFDNNQ